MFKEFQEIFAIVRNNKSLSEIDDMLKVLCSIVQYDRNRTTFIGVSAKPTFVWFIYLF